MKRSLAVAIMCCAFALTMGLVACGGSSSGSAASSAASGTSSASTDASSAASSADSSSASSSEALEINPNHVASDDGVTLTAACELTGPEFTRLVKHQRYTWDTSWKNRAVAVA